MNLFQTLQTRGYLYQYTNEDEIVELLKRDKPFTFYMGIDPTAGSLHIGHFFALMMFRHLQEAGHRGILVIGGATALVGDPTGKKDVRKKLSYDEVEGNFREVERLSRKFIQMTEDNPAIILNNADWILPYGYIDFLRDIGSNFNVNTMLNSEAYAKRLESGGLTFLEMGYMLMQAYDFVYLYNEYDCILQIGGSDQWGNISAGVSLHRKMSEKKERIFGLTCPLLVSKDGKKMGKTEEGTLWVAREKTTVFHFYQYFYNIDDENVKQLLNLFTRIPQQEIETMVATDILRAKKTMAYEVTKLVHGAEEADKVLKMVETLFQNSGDADAVPPFVMKKAVLEEGIDIVSLLVETRFIESRSEAKRLILQGGISLDGKKIDSIDNKIDGSTVENDTIMLKRGKKQFLKITFS